MPCQKSFANYAAYTRVAKIASTSENGFNEKASGLQKRSFRRAGPSAPSFCDPDRSGSLRNTSSVSLDDPDSIPITGLGLAEHEPFLDPLRDRITLH